MVFDSVVQEGRLFLALFDLDRKGDSTGSQSDRTMSVPSPERG